MDTRFKFREIRKFLKNLRIDYRSGLGPTKKQKVSCYIRTLRMLFMYIWNGLSAPIVYPFWYIFRKKIVSRAYRGTSWQEINKMVEENKTSKVKSIIKNNGKFIYWLWTYGDLRDPLGRGELMDRKTNTFWNRYWENAFRNCRFTINFMEFRTASIVDSLIVIDSRNFNYMHVSEGIGNSPDGIFFRWMCDSDNKWSFIYEDNNKENIFYYGYVGMHKPNIIGLNGRFEIGYRKTGSSFKK